MNLKSREWVMAYRNIWRNKRRSMAFFLAMTFTVCGLSMLGGYIVRTESLMRTLSVYLGQNGHLTIYKKDGFEKFDISPKKYQIKADELIELKKILSSKDLSPYIDFYGEYLSGMGIISRGNSSTTFIASGVIPEINGKIYQNQEVLQWIEELELKIPKNNLAEAERNNPNSISVTKNMGELIGIQYPVEVNDSRDLEVQLAARNVYGDLNAVNANIALNHTTGFVFAEDTSLIMPLKMLQELLSMDGVGHVSIFIKDVTDIFKIQNILKNKFNESKLQLDVFPFFDPVVGEMYSGSMGFMMVMALFFILMVYSAGILSITNVVFMNILERTKEIGTMRCLGFDKNSIARVFMKETIIVAVFSIIAGNVLIFVISHIVNALDIRIFPPYIPGSMKFYLYSNLLIRILVAVPLLLISTISSYYIAKNKTKKNISHLIGEVVR